MNLFIRNFPNEIHKALKVKAAQLEISLSNLIIKTLEVVANERKIENKPVKNTSKE